jgi:hypothetical protein
VQRALSGRSARQGRPAKPAVETPPSGPVPHEPIVAVVRDAQLGEVTVLAGKTEKTFRDRTLVKRLLKVAAHTEGGKTGEVA